jgi:hypothetical protein
MPGVRPHLLEVMGKLLFSALLISLLAAPAGRTCSCSEASGRDVPYGANEYIEQKEATVKRVLGKVTLAYGEQPVQDAVVEVYAVPDVDRHLEAYKIAGKHPRRAACVTGADGSFCFPDLPSGLYVLRAGAGRPSGTNEVYMRVVVDRRWWSKWFRPGKAISLGLAPGT